MNYWHMNLHPTGKQGSDDDIKNIVLSRTVGMGIWERTPGIIDPQINDFKNRVSIGDIVLVLNGRTPIALVKVIGDWYEFYGDEGKDTIVWYPLRRSVEILGISDMESSNCCFGISMIPKNATPTLAISLDKNCGTYKYIDNLYKCCTKKA